MAIRLAVASDAAQLLVLANQRRAERVAEFGGEVAIEWLRDEWLAGRLRVAVDHTGPTINGALGFYNHGDWWELNTAWWRTGASVSTIRTRARALSIHLAGLVPGATKLTIMVVAGTAWDTYLTARVWMLREAVTVNGQARVLFSTTAGAMVANL